VDLTGEPERDVLLEAARAAILAMDQTALDVALAAAEVFGEQQDVARHVDAALLAGGHEVQQFWLGECVCHRPQPQVQCAVACPVTVTAELVRIGQEAGVVLPAKYPGSIAAPCTGCADPVWVGPRLQQALAANPAMRLLCYLCAVQEPGYENATEIDLGNTAGQPPA
jgi:hypothetical protein